MTTLFIGPLLQEFGHAVQSVGVMRQRAKDYDRTIVCALPERFALYADFATEFWKHDIRCSCNMDRPKDPAKVQELVDQILIPVNGTDVWVPGTTDYASGQGVFIPYGRKSVHAASIIFHARGRRDLGRDHNWPIEKWTELAQRVGRLRFTMVSVGHPDQSFHVPGTDDGRGMALGRLMDVLASGILAVGPSSGAMHLASHCRCPHVTWNGDGAPGSQRERSLRKRYAVAWNPHGTPAHMLESWTWKPEVDEVFQAIERALP